MKTKRRIIAIDEGKCDGCGACASGCPEGALKIIDGKARLVSELLCDGLGACLGECPKGAISTLEREAEPYDEGAVMERMAAHGPALIKAHLLHLRDHGQKELLNQAKAWLAARAIPDPLAGAPESGAGCGCPGAMALDLRGAEEPDGGQAAAPSRLRQWPVQLHLISPSAPYFRKAELLVAADCTAFACGGFHEDFLKGKALVIACPKLDDGREMYLEKLCALVDEAQVNTITVLTMEVPCCGGLLALVKEALAGSRRKVPLKSVIINLRGGVKSEEWV